MKALLIALCLLPLASHAAEPKEIFLVLSGGLTYGGDNLATVHYSDGSSDKIKAGGLVQLGIGGEWHPANWPVSLRATANLQTMPSSGRSGSASFSRSPLELLGYYHINENWLLGAGVRRVSDATYKRDFENDPSSGTATFKPATGGIVEFGYKFSPRHQLVVRYVNERYTLKSTNTYPVVPAGSYDGSHGGIFVNLLF